MAIQTTDPYKLRDDELPALYDTANRMSLNGQKKYLQLARADLTLLVLGAAISAISLTTLEGRKLLAGLSAIAFLAGFVLTAILWRLQFERDWYGGRAIAESIKTLAWRYMTRAEPFTSELTVSQARERFLDGLRDVLAQRPSLAIVMNASRATAGEITPRMQEVREATLETRKTTYLHGRIEDQRDWYSRKAADNARLRITWLFAIAGAQFLAMVSAAMLVVWPDLPISLAGFFSSLAAAVLAWLQIKQHQELAQSYSQAAHELALIAERLPTVRSEQAFSVFVADAEKAISREHTLWTARRDAV